MEEVAAEQKQACLERAEALGRAQTVAEYYDEDDDAIHRLIAYPDGRLLWRRTLAD